MNICDKTAPDRREMLSLPQILQEHLTTTNIITGTHASEGYRNKDAE